MDDLKKRMEALLEKGISDEESEEIRKQMEEKYNWDNIAEQTIEVYRKAVRAEGRGQRAEGRGQRTAGGVKIFNILGENYDKISFRFC